jgi:hypothetical protein
VGTGRGVLQCGVDVFVSLTRHGAILDTS